MEYKNHKLMLIQKHKRVMMCVMLTTSIDFYSREIYANHVINKGFTQRTQCIKNVNTQIVSILMHVFIAYFYAIFSLENQ